MVRRALAAAAAVALVLGAAAPARAETRAEQWRALAEQTLQRFEDVDNVAEQGNTGGTFYTRTYAWAAEASGRLRGWDDPRTQRYLTKVLSLKTPDGGFGIGWPVDVLSDGTTNPASTTYTVSMAHHVGEAFLEAYKHDALPAAEVQNLVNQIMATPRINTAAGDCVAYSKHPNDSVVYACVHNVNAGAGMFLLKAKALGFNRTGLAALVEGITRREVASYDVAAKNWHYADTRFYSDADHTSYSAESMLYLAPQLGFNVAYQMMITAYSDNDKAPVTHLRLSGLPTGVGPLPPAPADVGRWCTMADRWTSEVQTYIDGLTDPDRMTQAAQLAARNADACKEA